MGRVDFFIIIIIFNFHEIRIIHTDFCFLVVAHRQNKMLGMRQNKADGLG